MSPRRRVLLLLATLGLAVFALGLSRPGFWRWVRAERPSLPAVVFVVMDTVRADHLSACGYERPTSPVLERLVAEGADLSCHGVAPGSWTLPSHATFFTGQMPWEHRADFAEGGEGLPGRWKGARALRPTAPTLAEAMAATGRATVMVAANPVLTGGTGLTRGFAVTRIAETFDALRGPDVVRVVEEALSTDEVRGRDGLFLTLNLFDAHNPLAAVPDGLGWVPPRPRFTDNPLFDPDDPFRRYLQGRMASGEAAGYLQAMRDGYDYGVYLEDRALGGVLRVLHAKGWDRAGLRLVVTSDHGELLGEHGGLTHGPFLHEGTQRVPILTKGVEGRLPAGVPVSAAVVHELVLSGRVPARLPEAAAVSVPTSMWTGWSAGRFGAQTQVARWQAREKVLSRDGQASRIDLAADPGEERPIPLTAAEVPASVREIEAALAVPPPEEVLSPELIEGLRRAGYLE